MRTLAALLLALSACAGTVIPVVDACAERCAELCREAGEGNQCLCFDLSTDPPTLAYRVSCGDAP
jgi:hypothetical protein